MKQIQLTQGKFALVDDEDFESLSKYKWIYNHGYAVRASRILDKGYRDGGLVMMHRQIMDFPDGKQIDHINHVCTDNRRENLRACSRSENLRNKNAKRNKIGTSYKGVSYHKATGKWGVVFQCKWFGYYQTDIEGAIVYDELAKKEYGAFAKINFPDA